MTAAPVRQCLGLNGRPQGIASPSGSECGAPLAVRAPSGGPALAGEALITPDDGRPIGPGFRVDVRPERERVVVAPAGDVDLATVPHVRDHLDELVASGFRTLVLDLRGVTFMDSTGLTLLVRESARPDAELFVVDGGEPVSRLLDISGVRGLLRMLAPGDVPQHS